MNGMFLLPKEIEIEILLGLPIKSLFRFKSICKNWCFSIRSRSFVSRYSHGFNSRDNKKILCYRKDPITKIDIVSLLDYQNNSTEDLQCPPILEGAIENKELVYRDIKMSGPVKGIYCVYYRVIERLIGTLVLWNPTTREYKHILPPIRYPFPFQLLAVNWNTCENVFDEKNPTGLHIGFGCAHSTNDFKVVVISQWQHFYGRGADGWHVKVYAISSDSWRTIYYLTSYSDALYSPFQGLFPLFPSINSNPEFSYGFLNGLFHWSGSWRYNANPSWSSEGIVAFNMANESFQLMKGPSDVSRIYNCRSVWVLKETLLAVLSSIDFDRNPFGIIELWLMKEYGVENSWTMLHSLGPFGGLRFIGIPTDDQIFFCDIKGELVSYKFNDHNIKKYGLYGLIGELPEFDIGVSVGVLTYAETILPLNAGH